MPPAGLVPSVSEGAVPAPDPGGAASPGRRLPRAVWWALGAVALAALLWAVVSQGEAVIAALRRLDAAAVLVAFACVLGGLAAGLLSWRAILAGLGSPLPVAVAGRIYLVAQLAKYLPGSVWSILAQAELARDQGVPRLHSGVAAVAVLIVASCVGGVVAAICLAGSATAQLRQYAWTLLVVPAGLIVLHPRVLQWVLDLALRALRRHEEPHAVTRRGLLEAAGWALVMWLLFGAHVWVLARALGADGAGLALLSIGAYAAAWIVGFLVLFAPAGAGPREIVLVLALAPALPRAEAVALALASRVLMMVGELAGVIGALGLARARRRRDVEPR